MATRLYPALIEARSKADGGGYGVTFPDLPNVFTDGETVEEAFHNAKDVLQAMLDTMQTHGDDIPAATSLTEVKAPKGVIVQAFEGQVESAKTVKLSVTMDEELVARIDAEAGARGRSAFLAAGARNLLAQIGQAGRSGMVPVRDLNNGLAITGEFVPMVRMRHVRNTMEPIGLSSRAATQSERSGLTTKKRG